MNRKSNHKELSEVPVNTQHNTLSKSLVLIVVFVAIPFYPLFTTSKDGLFGFQFVHWDDDKNFVNNPYWRGFSFQNFVWTITSTHIDVWEPLSWILKQIQYEIYGESSAYLHIVTLLIHIINSILLFVFLETFFRTIQVTIPSIGNLFASISYGIHPLRCEVVGWASGQSYAVACFFSLWSAICYLHYLQSKKSQNSKFNLSIFCYGLAVLSKTSAISVCLGLLVMESFIELYSTSKDRRNAWNSFKNACKSQGTFIILFVVFLSISFASSGTHLTKLSEQTAQLDIIQKILRACYALCFYLCKLVWPTQLAPVYSTLPDVPLSLWEDQFYMPLGVVGTVSLVSLVTMNQVPWLSAVWFSYMALLLPMLGFAHMQPLTLAFDRYTYISIIPFHILIAAGIGWMLQQTESRKISANTVYLGLFSVLLLFGFMSSQQVENWRTTASLYLHTLKVSPGETISTANLGTFYMDHKRFKEACILFDKGVLLHPSNLGLVLHSAQCKRATGHSPEAMALLKNYLGKVPTENSHVQAQYKYELAVSMFQSNRQLQADAMKLFDEALAIEPQNAVFMEGKNVALRVLIQQGSKGT